MTEKQFYASKWKPFEVMRVYHKEYERFCECLLIAVDFEDRMMKLQPLDGNLYEDEAFEAPINVITRGKIPKLKIVG